MFLFWIAARRHNVCTLLFDGAVSISRIIFPGGTSRVILHVTIQVKPEHVAEFLEIVRYDAEHSEKDEQECLRLVDPSRASHLWPFDQPANIMPSRVLSEDLRFVNWSF